VNCASAAAAGKSRMMTGKFHGNFLFQHHSIVESSVSSCPCFQFPPVSLSSCVPNDFRSSTVDSFTIISHSFNLRGTPSLNFTASSLTPVQSAYYPRVHPLFYREVSAKNAFISSRQSQLCVNVTRFDRLPYIWRLFAL
jgi:hypothetical protein